MTKAEERISKLEKQIIQNPEISPPTEALCFALCEIARQLARIGDIYEFELGLEETPESNFQVAGAKR